MKPGSPSTKVERKVVERERRIHMKKLSSQLSSLLPKFDGKVIKPQMDQVQEAIDYIKELQEKIEKMEERKKALMRNDRTQVEVQALGSSLVVVLTSDLNYHFLFYEVISVIEEEGAEVLTTNLSTVGDKVFHTIHSQVRDFRISYMRIYERLMKLVQ